MKRGWQVSAKVIAGLALSATLAMPQRYTVSAKPGVVNYVEGNAFLDGSPLSAQSLKMVSLNANDVLSTDIGKAEVLLTPGVFLRIGDNTQVRMVSPSLTDTQIEIKSGSAMIEVDDLVKENHLTVVDHGGTVSIEKPGLYRISAGDPPTVATLEGKAEVYVGEQKIDLGKGRETVIADGSKVQKFDTKQQDDLYAWSNVRSEYDAASSYQVARNVSVNSFGGGWGDYGFSGMYSPGWFWNSGFNSWAWMPGAGAFYSPFGFGFYSPGMIGYAPVIYAPVSGGGGAVTTKTGTGITTAVPVNPSRPPATGLTPSPAVNQTIRTAVLNSYSSSGFATASGIRVPAGSGSTSAGRASSGSFASMASGTSSSSSSYSAASSSHGSSSGSSVSAGHAGGGSHR